MESFRKRFPLRGLCLGGGGDGRWFGLSRQDSGRGCEPVEQRVDREYEQTVGKTEKNTEDDSQNKSKPVWLQVGDPKGPYLFKFFQRVAILAMLKP